MKVAILCLVLLQSLCCFGFPSFKLDLTLVAPKALHTSLDKINTQSTSTNLYGITHSSIKKVILLGTNAYDLMLNFRIRETVCLKASETNPEKCDFKQGFFVSTASCSSRVRVSSGLSELISLTCSRADSSSSSSESNSGEALGTLSGMNGPNLFGPGAGTVNTPTMKKEDNRLQGNGLSNFLE